MRLEVDPEYMYYELGNQNVLAKKSKAMNVEGFDVSMYNMDYNQKFDRANYRTRKREARMMFPEYTRRQRKAWALIDDSPAKISIEANVPNLQHIAKKQYINVPEFYEENIYAPSKIHLYTQYALRYKPKPVNFNQFAGLLDDRLSASKPFRTGSDLRKYQNWRAQEYLRYIADPLNYKYEQMPQDYQIDPSEEERYRQMGILSNNRGAGYYDPNDKSFESQILFTDHSILDALNKAGYTDGYKTYWKDETGAIITDENILSLLKKNRSNYSITVNPQRINAID